MAGSQPNDLYELHRSRDPRSDGHFFIGVSTTRIYCRPTCGANPKAENCNFFKSAAAAENAGFRPCLVCRPELAPGVRFETDENALSHCAARLIKENSSNPRALDETIRILACEHDRLESEFINEYGIDTQQYLSTCRLHLAKALLTDSDLSLDNIARATGFENGQALKATFESKYRLKTDALKRRKTPVCADESTFRLLLGYRPPYRWDAMLRFFANRTIPGVEATNKGVYARSVRMCDWNGCEIFGWIRVSNHPHRNALVLEGSSNLLPVLSRVVSKAKDQFDLRCDPETVFEALSGMDSVVSGANVAGIRLPGCFDPYEMAVRAILGQQITVKAASTIAGRLVMALGVPMDTGIEGLTHAFFVPKTILSLEGSISDHLGPLGVTAVRAHTISELARGIVSEFLDFGVCANPLDMMKRLQTIRGIGDWTAQYIAMRALGHTDAFPATDYGVKKALEPLSVKQITEVSQAWKPWRAYATINLWNSL